MKAGQTQVNQEFALQASEDDGKTWSDERICQGAREAVEACFDARQKVQAIHYRAVQRLTLIISPQPNERAHV